jgi:hypothetical protein
MNNKEEITKLESNTIQPIALDERHGTAKDLFTIWFGVNIMLLTIVTGALSVSVFKLRFDWAVTALALGNLVGAIFMALHAAQGPQLGVPQMVQTRGSVRLHRFPPGGRHRHHHVRGFRLLEPGAHRRGAHQPAAGIVRELGHRTGGHFGIDRRNLWL